MEVSEWERKPFFIGHNTICVIDIYEPHERDLLNLWKGCFESEDVSEEQWIAKQVNLKKAARELINHLHGRWCVQFLNELMVICAEEIMNHWKEFSPEEQLPEYKKSLIEDIKKVIGEY